jgi:hypothetical protein
MRAAQIAPAPQASASSALAEAPLAPPAYTVQKTWRQTSLRNKTSFFGLDGMISEWGV